MTDTDPMPDREAGVLEALNAAWDALDMGAGHPEKPIELAPAIAVAFRETANQMRRHGAWLLKNHKKGAVGLNKALAMAAEELDRRADALDTLAGQPTQTAAEHTERDAALLRATADDFTPGGPKVGGPVEQYDNPSDPHATGECGATWQGQGFDPCILADDGHTIHEGKNSKWPRESTYAVSGEMAVELPDVAKTGRVATIIDYLKGETDELGTPSSIPGGVVTVTGRAGDKVVTIDLAEDSPDAKKVMAGVLGGHSVSIENPQVVHANPEPGGSMLSDPPADPFSDPVSNGGRPHWLPEPDPRPYSMTQAHEIGDRVFQPAPLAVHQSDIKLGEECGLALRLKYRDGVKPVPTWWNEGGHAFHVCIERWERLWIDMQVAPDAGVTCSDESAREWFNAALDQQIATVTAETGFGTELWRAANKGTEGEAWWRENGPHMVRDYAAWSAARHADGWSIAMVAIPTALGVPSWEPALEARFSYPDPITSILREGTLDQIWIRPVGYAAEVGYEVELIDPKSWRKPDEDPLQLKFYAGAVASLLPGVPIARLRAAYYDGRAGKLGDLIDPTAAMDDAEVSYRAATIDAMHQTNVYPANPGTEYGKPCGICEFRYACPIMARRDIA